MNYEEVEVFVIRSFELRNKHIAIKHHSNFFKNADKGCYDWA
jgi:hypothetical protein